ncbi:MAG: pyridoxal phosphate-dependent aminotransferase [Oscillospiraceae bacterium]|nr:pyridoxal phosphate-dependent aminotransferase [Oscillospiraceae bacterium]
MISEKMKKLAQNNSVIRAMFEEGKQMAKEFGAENVYDFSLGNPSVPAPQAVRQAAIQILDSEDSLMVHGYMSNTGYEDVRDRIAFSINERFQTAFTRDNLIMTVGAAGGLNVILKTLLNPGDEVLTFAPFFTEYTNYVANYDAALIAVSPNLETFQPNLSEFRQRITAKTKAVIINTPNNPTGVVYSAQTLTALGEILEEKQQEFGAPIYLISDEPYRELAYDGVEVPYVTKYYRNTIVGYSWSKSLSLPGERIGYLVIPSEADDAALIYSAASIATRVLGFVNAPSLLQRVVAQCLNEKTDIAVYDRNRELLYGALRADGFACIKPEGAFYLFVKAPNGDDKAFVARAKQLHILIVPATSFGCPGYVRIAYCVSHETIQRSLPAFRQLAQEYGLC